MKWLVYIGRAVNLFEASFQEVLGHVNTKRIQAREFEAVTNKKNARVLQMESAMVYECMYQDEVQSACWSRGSVNLFTAASISKPPHKTYPVSTHSKHKDNYSILVFVEYIYEFLFSFMNTFLEFATH